MKSIRTLFLRAPDAPITTAAPLTAREALAAAIAKVEAEKVVQGELRGRFARIAAIEAAAQAAHEAVADFKRQHAARVNDWLLRGGEQPAADQVKLGELEATYRQADAQAAAAAASRPETTELLLAAIQRHTALIEAMQPFIRAVLGEEMQRQQVELSRHITSAAAVIERLEGLALLRRDLLHERGENIVTHIGELPKLPTRRAAKGAARQTWRRLLNRLGADPFAKFEDCENDAAAIG